MRLYLTQTDAQHSIVENGIALSFSDRDAALRFAQEFNRRYVRLEGLLDMAPGVGFYDEFAPAVPVIGPVESMRALPFFDKGVALRAVPLN